MATKAKKNPRLASGRKRARQNVKLNAANTSLRSKYRTAVKNVEKAVLAGDKVTIEMSPYDLNKGRVTFRHLETRSGGGAAPRRRPN